MEKQVVNNVKLGGFVLGGLIFLMLLLYMIGKNQHLFGDTYQLKARFENVQGLMAGNNVRYAGIQTGTVKEINIINDTTIEVEMLIDKKMQPIIRKNAIVNVGTEGFVGNKVVNIVPARETAPLAVAGDILMSKKSVSTDEMLQTLSKTNNDAAAIAASLKETVQRINNSTALWELLNDQSIPNNLKLTVANIRRATGKADEMTGSLQQIVADIKHGKGSAGILLHDSIFALQLTAAAAKIRSVGNQADDLLLELQHTVAAVNNDIENGKGIANALLKDTAIVHKISASLDNIQQGTESFNQSMDAVKHSFLFRGYFRKLEKKKAEKK